MPSRIALALIVTIALVSCAAPAASPSTPTATATSDTTSTSIPTASALPAGARRFAIVPERSLATIRVREQIASIPAPGDAILTTRAFTGTVVLLPDGGFASGSTFAADLDTLKSDEPLRDEWIKINTLNTRVYPRASSRSRA